MPNITRHRTSYYSFDETGGGLKRNDNVAQTFVLDDVFLLARTEIAISICVPVLVDGTLSLWRCALYSYHFVYVFVLYQLYVAYILCSVVLDVFRLALTSIIKLKKLSIVHELFHCGNGGRRAEMSVYVTFTAIIVVFNYFR